MSTYKESYGHDGIATEYLHDFESEISALEHSLRKIKSSRATVELLLKSACKFYDADRAYVIETDWELGIGCNTYEWCADGIAPQSDILQNVMLSDLPRWEEASRDNHPVVLNDIEELKENYPKEYELLRVQGIRTLLAVPAYRRISGYIGVDNPRRYIFYTSFLQSVCFCAASEIHELNLINCMKGHKPQAGIETDRDVLIKLFGGLEVWTKKGVLTEDDVKSPLICKLLVYLLFTRKRRSSLRDICNTLWPDQLLDNPAKALKNIVYRARHSFGPLFPEHLIIYAHNTYELNPELNIKTDADIFESLCGKAQSETDVENKMRIYQHAMDLFDSCMLPSMDAEHWFISTVTYYNILFLNMAKDYLRLLETHDMHLETLQIASRLISFESDDAELHCLIMKVLLRCGSTELARKHFQQSARYLSEEQTKSMRELIEKPERKAK